MEQSLLIKQMKSSKLFDHYKCLKTHVGIEKYLNLNIPWAEKFFILQLRLGADHFTFQNRVLRLNKLENIYYKEKVKNCETCNKLETEDFFHVCVCCPHYSHLRKKYLWWLNSDPSWDKNKLLATLCAPYNKIKLKQLYLFWKSAVKLRNFLLDI